VTRVVASCGSGCDNPMGAGLSGSCGTVTVDGSLRDSIVEASGVLTRTIKPGIYLAALAGDLVLEDGDFVTGTLGGNYKISVADGAKVWFNNVTINGSDDEDYAWAGVTCLGDATIVLEGSNDVCGFAWCYPGIHVPANKTLTIEGMGALSASSHGYAAGIGGGEELPCGNIVIDGGTITATGAGAPGIGGGYQVACGNIVINGGTVNSIGGDSSAGIGSAYKGSCGSISINGGTVTASGKYGSAGIGGAYEGSCGSVSVGAGVTRVVAICGLECDDPIGAGLSGSCGTVTVASGMADVVTETSGVLTRIIESIVYLSSLSGDITLGNGQTATGTLGGNYKVSIADGATVTLRDANINTNGTSTGSTKWAGLTCEGDATIILEGESVVKAFNSEYPGIYVPKGYALTIKGDGALEVRGGSLGAAGIGGGSCGTCGNIVIDADEGCYISATGGGFGAGIGSGLSSDYCGDITINGGTVDAVGGGGAAGIGSGNGGTCGDIEINGGVIDAVGGNAGPGIGSGNAGSCDDITINGGTITATGGDSAAGIGTGSSYNLNMSECGEIIINGGAVYATGGDSAAGIGTGREGYCWGVYIDSDIYCVEATCGADCVNPIGAGVDGECDDVTIDTGLHDETSQDGKTRTLTPVDGFATWAEEKGLTGEDAEWGAKPAMWGGLANAFVYTFGEGLADGTLAIMSISFDAAGKPVITTAPVVQDHTDFTVMVIGSSSLDDWTSPVELEKSGNDWTLPSGQTASFFRVRLSDE
jgi:hypothetical protein